MIRFSNMPDPLCRQLKVRTALAGVSFSRPLLGGMPLLAERSTHDELSAPSHQRPAIDSAEPSAYAVRSERDARYLPTRDRHGASALLECPLRLLATAPGHRTREGRP